jgi:putative ABC transport system permease protein
VTGVFEDVPSNSHVAFDFFLSLISLNIPYVEQFDSPNYLTYLLLAKGSDVSALESKINTGWKEQMGKSIELNLRSLLDVHFDTSVSNYGGNIKLTDSKYLLIFSVVAVLVLLIACINYVNLVTARANERGREVGIRKLSGAQDIQLSSQFILDSFLHILPAVMLGLTIFYLLAPYTHTFLGLSSEPTTFMNSLPVLKMAGLILVMVTILALLHIKIY